MTAHAKGHAQAPRKGYAPMTRDADGRAVAKPLDKDGKVPAKGYAPTTTDSDGRKVAKPVVGGVKK